MQENSENKEVNNNIAIDTLEEKFDKFLGKKEAEIKNLSDQLVEIKEVYDEFIHKPSPMVKSKAEKLSETFEKVKDYDSEIKDIESETKDFKILVFGKDEADTKSLKYKLNNLKDKQEEQIEEWQSQYETLNDKIEALLPGATSAGLAKSYYDQKRTYFWPHVIWSVVFIATMVVMVYYALTIVQNSEGIGDALLNILSRAPFFIPTIWLALFASKQQSQNRRLEQEYAHKETIAKSYEGYKREISDLVDSKNKDEILEKLVAAMVDSASYNPSDTLEKNTHNDSPPLFSSLLNKKSQ